MQGYYNRLSAFMADLKKEERRYSSAAVSLFFHLKYVVVGSLLLCIFYKIFPPSSLNFKPLRCHNNEAIALSQLPTPSIHTNEREYPSKKGEKVKITPRMHKKVLKPFNPDTASLITWQTYGFSRKQALVICNYRRKIGGFKTREQLERCFVIGKEGVVRLAKYLRFPKSVQEVGRKAHSAAPTLSIFNPDTASIQTFVDVGFSKRQAEAIIRFRNSLGGKFGCQKQFAKSYVVDSAALERLRPFLKFE